MPNQDIPATSSVDSCPVCHSRTGNGVSLYVPSRAPVKPDNPRPQAPAAPIPDHPPAQNGALQTLLAEHPTQHIQFWQGLAAGLAAAIVILFLIAVLLAG